MRDQSLGTILLKVIIWIVCGFSHCSLSSSVCSHMWLCDRKTPVVRVASHPQPMCYCTTYAYFGFNQMKQRSKCTICFAPIVPFSTYSYVALLCAVAQIELFCQGNAAGTCVKRSVNTCICILLGRNEAIQKQFEKICLAAFIKPNLNHDNCVSSGNIFAAHWPVPRMSKFDSN